MPKPKFSPVARYIRRLATPAVTAERLRRVERTSTHRLRAAGVWATACSTGRTATWVPIEDSRMETNMITAAATP